METKQKEQLVNIARKGFGVAHFVAQATADMIVNSEASFVNKFLGTDKQEVINQRVVATDGKIDKFLNRLNKKS